ncbi:MAG: S9 family peptidase, partial [Deltaproteobacteria bacterium]|nr:S9 family peptidase [Deltaproteobacteria bacterium]
MRNHRLMMSKQSKQFPIPSLALLSIASILILWNPVAPAARDKTRRLFTPADVHALVGVSDLAISPEGDWVAYSVETIDIDEDRYSSDLYMVSWDGETRVQLTHTEKHSETHPRFSPDGKYLAFIASRGGEGDEKGPKSKAQVWLLNRAGGEAQRVTELPGGVSDFEWAPGGQRLVLVSGDPDPDEVETEDASGEDDGSKPEKKSTTPKPIVVNRYQFKRDWEGFLGDRYERLYLFDLATRKATLLTEGAFDSTQPAWSPDGKWIAFMSKRPSEEQPDPDRTLNTDIYLLEAREGAKARKLTEWTGADSEPAWSPDGTKIAYVQGTAGKYAGYGSSQVAVLPIAAGAPTSASSTLPSEALDRSVSNLRWSLDGQTLFFGFDDDRERFVGSVPVLGGVIERLELAESALATSIVNAFEVGQKGIAVLATSPTHPPEIFRLGDGFALSDHNRALREQIRWAKARGIDVTSKDGTRIGAMLYEPPGKRLRKPLPTIAFIHGGPFAQDAYEFDWMAQAFAAAGYLVVQPNYRGSSGRGANFSRTLYARWADGVQDIHAVVDYLVDEGLADPKRLGIGGWSYGGINTNYAIATDTRFKAAVSGAGAANLITGYGTDQYIHDYEREVGMPWVEEDLALYLELSFPFFHADRIQT